MYIFYLLLIYWIIENDVFWSWSDPYHIEDRRVRDPGLPDNINDNLRAIATDGKSWQELGVVSLCDETGANGRAILTKQCHRHVYFKHLHLHSNHVTCKTRR